MLTHVNNTNVRAIPLLTPNKSDRFWSKIKVLSESDCWEWQSPCAKEYGSFAIGRNTYLSHRVAYLSYYNVDPMEKQVCHKCDNTKCCNPHHLFLGTNEDNLRDARNKGRAAITTGTNNLNAKLDENSVQSIRDLYYKEKSTQSAIAAQFNISRSTVSGIILGNQWKHIPQEIKKEVKGYGNSKLSEKEVVSIRYDFNKKEISIRRLAQKYSVTHITIYNIVNGITWKHLLPKKENKNLKYVALLQSL